MRNNPPATHSRSKLIAIVQTPLGFFVLLALIAESIPIALPLCLQLSPVEKTICMAASLGLLAMILIVVTALVWCRPHHLTFDKESHLRDRARAKEEVP